MPSEKGMSAEQFWEFGDHTECPICGTDCYMLFQEAGQKVDLAARLLAAEGERDRLKERLEKYGRMDADCPICKGKPGDGTHVRDTMGNVIHSPLPSQKWWEVDGKCHACERPTTVEAERDRLKEALTGVRWFFTEHIPRTTASYTIYQKIEAALK